MENNFRNNEKDKLSFNMAVDYTSKIAEYLHQVEILWAKGNLRNSVWELKKVWHKISPFIEDEKNNKIEKDFNDIQKGIFKAKNNKEKWIVNAKIEKMIMYLSKLLNDCGLLIPTSDDPRFLFRKK